MKKGVSKNASKKGAPPKSNKCLYGSIHRSGGSRRGGLACALYKQETIVRATFEALFEILAEKSELDSKSVQIVANKLNGLLNVVEQFLQKLK